MDKKKYAELLVKVGGNVQTKDFVVVSDDIANAEFTRLVVASAYEAGACEVVVRWNDSICQKMWYEKADDSAFDIAPSWLAEYFKHYDERKAVYLSITSVDPDLLKGADPARVKRNMATMSATTRNHSKNVMGNNVRWSIIAAPSPEWASKVFPGLPVDAAVEKLWDAIAEAARMNTASPVGEWDKHNQNFKSRAAVLNAKQFKSLKYKNSLGTDFEVGLPSGHIWLGGCEQDENGIQFNPNMPTEEIFTTPDRLNANGRVVSSMPLSYNGKLIEGFELTFKDGKAISCKARSNEAILQSIVGNDPGSCYLGEVALVPSDSPITRMGILFYNTLFDENASCHLALGKAYPTCVEGTGGKSVEELLEMGVNDSLLHVDFMVGTDDLSIVGIQDDGSEFPVFVDGMFTF
jgi:aminopeptidase